MLTFKTFESMKKAVAEHKENCVSYNQQRTAANNEVEEMKTKEGELLNRQIAGEEVLDELARTKAKVAVAEEKRRRLVEQIGAVNPAINLKGKNMLTLQSEIRRSIASGELLEQTMKAEMADLEEAKKAYLEAAEKALVKFHQVQGDVRKIQEEASAILGEPLVQPELPSTHNLRPTLWVESNDYNNEFYKVKLRAEASVNGPAAEIIGAFVPDEMVVKSATASTQKEYVDDKGTRWERQSVGVEKVSKTESVSSDPFAGLM